MSEACPPTLGSKQELTLLGKSAFVSKQATLLDSWEQSTAELYPPSPTPICPSGLAQSNALPFSICHKSQEAGIVSYKDLEAEERRRLLFSGNPEEGNVTKRKHKLITQ